MYILFLFAVGLLNAIMDRLENSPAFENSIFSHLDRKFWLKSESWQHVKFLPFTKYRPDAWHLAKSLMWLCVGGAVSTALVQYDTELPEQVLGFLPTWIALMIAGAAIVTFAFVLGYDFMFKRNAAKK